jgi:type IV pilus assembly protein PilN
MATLNLLPWREERRKELLRQFLTMTGLSIIFMLLLILAVHLHFGRLINAQEARNSFLKNEITAVEKKIREIDGLAKEKKRLLARMDVIQQLQRNRPGIVHLFEEMVKVIPEGAYIESLKQNGTSLTITGVAQSNARISAYMRNIDASPWLTKPSLNIIEKKGVANKTSGRNFILKAEQLAQPKK